MLSRMTLIDDLSTCEPRRSFLDCAMALHHGGLSPKSGARTDKNFGLSRRGPEDEVGQPQGELREDGDHQ